MNVGMGGKTASPWAPARARACACWTASFVEPAMSPLHTGQRPSAASRATSIARRRSSTERAGPSAASMFMATAVGPWGTSQRR